LFLVQESYSLPRHRGNLLLVHEFRIEPTRRGLYESYNAAITSGNPTVRLIQSRAGIKGTRRQDVKILLCRVENEGNLLNLAQTHLRDKFNPPIYSKLVGSRKDNKMRNK